MNTIMSTAKNLHLVFLIAFLGLMSLLVFGGRAEATTNPYYAIDPASVGSSPSALLSPGITYQDSVPDTLDLAERAQWFTRGAAQSHIPYMGIWIPGGPGFFNSSAPGASECSMIPCWGKVEGYPNWGKITLGMVLARAMHPYDRSDADGTLGAEYRSLTTMLDFGTAGILATINGGPGSNLVWAQRFITPSSVVMQALIARYEQDSSNVALKNTIDEYVRMHKELLQPVSVNGTTYYNYLDPATDLDASGYAVFAFVDGRAALALFSWYKLTGNQDALDAGGRLTNYLRNADYLWTNASAGQFDGHIHSYLQVAHAFLLEAEIRRATNPQDAIAQDNINRAQGMYEFVKSKTRGDVIGNFGEMDTVDDMIRVGLKLTDLGASMNYDDIERWTRNMLADRQIDSFTGTNYIGNYTTGNYATDHIGSKVTGLWFSDATHALSIPGENQMYNIDDATNPMHAMYDVWDHAVQVKGSFAQINFPLNRASEYLDVKSDLPYRGEVQIVMKGDIGPITAVGVRVPGWADQNAVTVVRGDSSGEHVLAYGSDWSWVAGRFVSINNIAPNVSYTVRFPIKIYQQVFYDIRSEDQFWYERTDEAFTAIAYTGTFRGYDLVDASPRPSSGIPRFQRQFLAQQPPYDVSPPKMTVQRFIMNGSLTVSTPTAALDANGQSSLSIYAGDLYVLNWSSSNVSGCTINYKSSITGEQGSFGVESNSSGSGTSGLIGSYAMSCAGNDGQSVSASVQISAIPTPPVITVDPATMPIGGRATVSWSAPEGSSCVYSSPTNSPTDAPYGTYGATGKIGVGPLTQNATYTITCNGESASATITVTPAPTAILTANGAEEITVRAGDPIDYAWSSSNGLTAASSYTIDSADACTGGVGPFPWVANTLNGTTNDPGVNSCQGGHAYTITYVVTGANSQTASDTVIEHILPAGDPTPTTPPQTATLTANGAGETTVSPGEYVTLNWSSTNAASATATIAPDSPDTCKTKLALSVTKGSGSYKLGPIGACRAGHAYTITYTAVDASGNRASASVIVHVRSTSASAPPSSFTAAVFLGIQSVLMRIDGMLRGMGGN